MSRPTPRRTPGSPARSYLRRWALATVAGAVLLTSCGQPAPTLDPVGEGPQPTDDEDARGSQLAWGQLDVVEATLPDRAAAAVFEDPDAIAAAWEQYGFDGEVPSIDPDTEVLLLLGRADNACPDELIGLEVADGTLVTEWLTPPGDCEDPLILWLYAVQVYRGVLGEEFTYVLDDPFTGELAPVTIELPPFTDDGSRTAPIPPEAMSDDEVDAVFADHPVRRCGPDDDPIAAAFGPLDEPLDEFDGEQEDALAHVDEAMTLLTDAGFEPHEDVTGLIDRSTGTSRAAVVVHEPRADQVQDLLDAELGTGTVTVWADPWDAREVAAAQEALGALMGPGTDGPGAIVSTSGSPGPVVVGMIDPTRAALDAIADRVDPSLVCVDVIRSGVAPQPTG